MLRGKYVKGKRIKIGVFSKIDGKYCIQYSLRPEKINNKKVFRHWEAHLIVSIRQSGYYHLLTLVERKTRLAIIRKIKGKILDQWCLKCILLFGMKNYQLKA